jgi:NADP-dependent 3-hydroxy acid dehydrogenase YdfG
MSSEPLPGERGTRIAIHGSVAVVTGASAGIGRATAIMLHERGARVVVAARRVDRLEELAARIDGLAVACDVGVWEQVEALVNRAVEWGGRLDIMVNNAGFGGGGALHEHDPLRVAKMVQTNVVGVLNGVRAAGAVMARQGSGGIVNVSSIVGHFPEVGSGAYAATKAAVDSISGTAYRELRGHGVHVVNVKPALTDTEFREAARGIPGPVGGDPPEKVARWICEALESGSGTAGYR